MYALRRGIFGILFAATSVAGVLSACATATELDLEEEPIDGSIDGDDGGRSSSSSSGNRSSSSSSSSSSGSSGNTSSGGSSSSGGGTSSSGGSSSGGLPSGPQTGSPCTTLGETYSRVCGNCGTQRARCVGDENTPPTVSPYGACEGDVVDGCAGGTTVNDVPCGYCGTLTRQCSSTSCTWQNGACQGSVTVATRCHRGTTTFDGSVCEAGLFSKSVCKDDCTGPGSVSACAAPPTTLAVPLEIDGESRLPVLAPASGSPTLAKITPNSTASTGGCPATLSATTSVYKYVELTNGTAKAVTVELNTDTSSMLVAAYAAQPTTETERRACLKARSCTSATNCLTTDRAVVVPANGSISVYLAPSGTTWPANQVTLSVKTTAIAD